jgi:hypothetical protein
MNIKNVVIRPVAKYNWLWLPLAKRLKNENGAKIHFICSPQYVKSQKQQNIEGIADSFISINHFFTEYDNCDGSFGDIVSQARYYENKYNTLVVDILQTDRHLGRGFSAAGVGHPRSELSNKATYIKSLAIFNKIIKFWEEYFEKVKPDLIINVISGIIGKPCAVMAKTRGIPIRTLNSARYQSYFYWVTDEYYSAPAIEKNFKSITNYKESVATDEIRNIKRLPRSDKYYKEYLQYRSKGYLIKQVVDQVRRRISRKCRRIVTMGNSKLSEDIRYLWRMHKAMRYLDTLQTVSVDKLNALSFIFYPLHTEPELSLGTFSPEFNEQMALIELIAKNLPAGTFLVVKEHLGALGRRPREFYSTLKDIPNVLLIHPCEYAIEAAKTARAVTVITSTVGTEAAIFGIPVISFGIHNEFNFLPHVHVVESWRELRPLLHKLCAEEDGEEAKKRRREDGMRYLAALKASSVDLSWSDYISQKRQPATEKEVDVLYSSLMQGLGINK